MTDIKQISLDLIDDPKLMAREKIDDNELTELMSSMRQLGLLQPIAVRSVGKRYEIIAGHRRTRAARLLGWPLIQAKIIKADEFQTLAMRLAENLQRLSVDPVSEAVFIGEIMLKYKKSADQIAEILGRKVPWIKDRIIVFEMPDYMKEHLRHKKYPLGAAIWLAKIPNEKTRRYYSNWAAVHGCTIACAHMWFEKLKESDFKHQDVSEITVEQPGKEPVKEIIIKCAQCGGDCPISEADNVWVHRRCPVLDKPGHETAG